MFIIIVSKKGGSSSNIVLVHLLIGTVHVFNTHNLLESICIFQDQLHSLYLVSFFLLSLHPLHHLNLQLWQQAKKLLIKVVAIPLYRSQISVILVLLKTLFFILMIHGCVHVENYNLRPKTKLLLKGAVKKTFAFQQTHQKS